MIREEVRPDVIIVSMPTLELASRAVGYGRKHNIPVLVDLRDLWPDIFVDALPKFVRPLGTTILYPYFRSIRRICRDATGLVGITPDFLSWGLKYAGRTQGPYDRVFYHAYGEPDIPDADREQADLYWETLGVSREHFIICFFGALTGSMDFTPVLRAAREMLASAPDVRFVLCGTGPAADQLREHSRELPNVIWPGWIDQVKIWSLMRRSRAGLSPYITRRDFEMSIPNKAVEYLAGGLPVLWSLGGCFRELIERERCGYSYHDGGSDSLIAQISRLRSETRLQSEMSHNAREVFRRELSGKNSIEGLAAHIVSLSAARSAEYLPKHHGAQPGNDPCHRQ